MQQFESFAQMQRDAAMRVMEMQRRAQAAMKSSPTPPGLPVPAETGAEPLTELPFAERQPEETASSAASPEASPSGEINANPAEEKSAKESERALITAILLLLIREKADERLIFALLYILI